MWEIFLKQIQLVSKFDELSGGQLPFHWIAVNGHSIEQQ